MKTPEPEALPRRDGGRFAFTAWSLLCGLLLLAALVPYQGSNAACSLALKPDGVVAPRRHSPSYDSSSRLASGLDGGAINRHLSPDTTPGGLQGPWHLALDWQPASVGSQPWRWWTPVAVHYSNLHLGANLAGLLLVALLGAAAGLPARAALAWFIAWPLTHLGLALRPELLHYGGLSGVLHAGVAVTAVWLVGQRQGLPRWVGGALVLGLAIKVLSEAPWGPVLQHPPGWDMAVAPWAHATGALAGLLCGTVASLRLAYRSRSS